MIGYKSRQSLTWPVGVTADDLAATGDAAHYWDVVAPIAVVRIGAVITTVCVSSAAIVVAADRRILTASDTGRVNGLDSGGTGVLTIAATAAAGKVYYQDFTPGVDLDPGDQIIFEVTTAATTSGAARYFVDFIDRDEVPANLSDMVSV